MPLNPILSIGCSCTVLALFASATTLTGSKTAFSPRPREALYDPAERAWWRPHQGDKRDGEPAGDAPRELQSSVIHYDPAQGVYFLPADGGR
jgi:hypothetical protein